MSDFKTSNNKKKDIKNHSTPTSETKSKRKKSKTRVSHEYEQNEKEVLALLDSVNLAAGVSSGSKDVDGMSLSQEFFSSPSKEEEVSTRRTALSTELTELSGMLSEDDDGDYGTESAAKTPSEPSSTSHSKQPTASSYIPIEMEALTQFVPKVALQLDTDLFYLPGKQLRLVVKSDLLQGIKPLQAKIVRMLNRYYEEAKASHRNVLEDVVVAMTLAQDRQQFVLDTKLYRTYCPYKFHPIFCKPSRHAVELPTRKFIRIYLKELQFTAHPGLLEEHRLANRLEDLYQEYTERVRTNLCEKLFAQLQTERAIVNEWLDQMDEEDDDDSEDPSAVHIPQRAPSVVQQRLFAVKALRNRLYVEEAKNKQLLKEIFDVWFKLKLQRRMQQFQCTRFRLRIKIRDDDDAAGDSFDWKERFQTDLNEIYREELETYYQTRRLWKQRHRSKDTLTKPKKPDLSKLSQMLANKFTECFFGPEEPRVEIERSRASEQEFYNIPEQKAYKLKSYFMKIYFDDQFVAETRNYRLEPDFSLNMCESIGVFVERRLPKIVVFVLYEKSKLPTPKKIASTVVPLPQCKNTTKSQTQTINLSSLKYPIAGRLGVRFQCDEENYPKQILSVLFSPPQKLSESTKKTGLNHGYSVDNAETDTTEVNETTENEFRNSTEDSDDDAGGDGPRKTFSVPTCTFEEDLLQFCAPAEVENNARLKLLRSRYLKDEIRTKDLRFIPALDNELEFDLLKQPDAVIDPGNWMDPIDLHKHEGKKYLKNLYEAINSQCLRLSKVTENPEDLLIGDQPASWSFFFKTLSLIFHPGRGLNPMRSNTLSSNIQRSTLDSNQQFNIVLNVVRATGIPVRSRLFWDADTRRRSSLTSSIYMAQNLNYSNVRPFVTLSYKDKLCRTITAEGSNPIWNEQIVLQLSGNLTHFREDIKISIFDEIIEQHTNDEPSVRSVDIYQRVHTNWLGEYRIPFNTMLSKCKIEGVFELSSPKLLLGYRRPTLDNITTNSDTNIAIEQYPEIKEAVRLWCYLSIAPTFELERVNTACLECVELKEVRQHLHEWGLQVKDLQPTRYVEPLVTTTDGKRVCITRLLEPMPLPVESTANLLDSACRYVSLLGVLKQYDACMGLQGVWLNNQVLLDTTWGSAKDLGVLLCNFLLTIGLHAYLALGESNQYGECVFVLYRTEEGELQFIDPCSGKRYSTKDVFCPLTKIYCVVAQDNIYSNIQTEGRVPMMNYNFPDSTYWIPAFNKRNPAPLGGVQNLSYVYHHSFRTNELRKNIERKIMKKVNTWRSTRKTIWNRALQNRLQNILKDLEELCSFVGSSFQESKYIDQLTEGFPSYKINGCTLNFPYINLTAISDRIKSTGLHLNSDKSVEFSVGVHIHTYPNNVVSVWVFLVTMTPM